MEGRVWMPPYEAVIDPHVQFCAEIIFGIGALLTLVYAVIKAVREKDIVPIYLFIGSVIFVLVEPFVDVHGLCWYPEINQHTVYRCIGRPMPLYLVFCIIFYVGATVIYLMSRFKKGITAGWLVAFYLIASVFADLFEPIPLHYDLWMYYGNQPFIVLKLPLWWGPVNVGCVLLTAVALFKALPYLQGWRKVAVIPLMPTAGVLAHTGCGFIINSTLNTFQGELATSLAAIASVLMTILIIWLAGHIISEKPINV